MKKQQKGVKAVINSKAMELNPPPLGVIDSNISAGANVALSFPADAPVLKSIKFLQNFSGSVNGKDKSAKANEIKEVLPCDFEYYDEYAKIEVLNG